MMKFKPNQTRTYDREGFKKRAACLCFRSEQEDEVGRPAAHAALRGAGVWGPGASPPSPPGRRLRGWEGLAPFLPPSFPPSLLPSFLGADRGDKGGSPSPTFSIWALEKAPGPREGPGPCESRLAGVTILMCELS